MINILVSVVWETIILLDIFTNANKEKTTEDKVKDITFSFKTSVQNSLAFA